MAEKDVLSEIREGLRILQETVNDCQLHVVELEAIPGEISTRYYESNNIQSSISYEEECVGRGGVGAEAHQSSLTQLHNHLSNLQTQIQSWNQYLTELKQRSCAEVESGFQLALRLFGELVHGHLLPWKRSQKLGQVGGPVSALTTQLDQMDECFEALLTEFARLRSVFESLKKHFERSDTGVANGIIPSGTVTLPNFDALLNQINTQIEQLLTESLVVAVQPPPIMMITRTPATDHSRRGARPPCQPVLRMLGGTKVGLRFQPLTVNCYLISEEEAVELRQGNCTLQDIVSSRVNPGKTNTCPNLVNTEATMQESESRFFAQFGNMHVTRRGGTATESSGETVPRRRYYLLFVVGPLGGGLFPAPLTLYQLSLPIALLTHPKQERQQGGNAFIFWELAFSQSDGILTDSPVNGVSANEFAKALNYKFLQYTEARRGLDDNALQQLVQRLDEHNTGFIKKTDFFDRIVGTDEGGAFTFRKWFYACMDILRERNLIEAWDQGLIIGFMSRAESERILWQLSEPALIIKFSFSMRDLIISYGSQNGVEHVLPRSETMRHLGPLPLTEVVKSTDELNGIQWIYGANLSSTPSDSPPFYKKELLWASEQAKPVKSRKTPQESRTQDEPYKLLQLKCRVKDDVVSSPEMSDALYNMVNYAAFSPLDMSQSPMEGFQPPAHLMQQFPMDDQDTFI